MRWALCALVPFLVLLVLGTLLLDSETQRPQNMAEAEPLAATEPLPNSAVRMASNALPPPPQRPPASDLEDQDTPRPRSVVPTPAPVAPLPGREVPAGAPERDPGESSAKEKKRNPVTNPALPRRNLGDGERLLAQAEKGDLELTRIGWPESSEERARLDSWLHGCVGVRNAYIRRGTLSAAEPDVEANASGRFSGLVRRIEGIPAPAEIRRLARLRARGATGTAVRLFPREFDAALLGTLSSIGVLQSGAQVRYRFNDRLALEVNGKTVEITSGFINRCHR